MGASAQGRLVTTGASPAHRRYSTGASGASPAHRRYSTGPGASLPSPSLLRVEDVAEGVPLGKLPLVQVHADGVVLLHGLVEHALHVAVRACAWGGDRVGCCVPQAEAEAEAEALGFRDPAKCEERVGGGGARLGYVSRGNVLGRGREVGG
jgi:hypothetical protein